MFALNQTGLNNSSRVNIPSTSPQMLNTATYIFLVTTLSISNSRKFLADLTEPAFAYYTRISCSSNGTGANLEIDIGRATTDTSYITNTAPLVIGVPIWIVYTFDINATPSTHIYTAGINGQFTEATYSVSTNGAGALLTSTPVAFNLLNVTSVTPNRGWQGNCWLQAFYKRVIPINNIFQVIRNPAYADAGYWTMGDNGTGSVIDKSGLRNHGTITGSLPTSDRLPMIRIATNPQIRKFGKVA